MPLFTFPPFHEWRIERRAHLGRWAVPKALIPTSVKTTLRQRLVKLVSGPVAPIFLRQISFAGISVKSSHLQELVTVDGAGIDPFKVPTLFEVFHRQRTEGHSRLAQVEPELVPGEGQHSFDVQRADLSVLDGVGFVV